MILERELADIDAPSPRRLDRWWTVALEHPCLTAAAVGLTARVVLALLSFRFTHGYLIPDERQYVTLAGHVAGGRTADSWAPFYGQSLYDSTWTYVAPLVQLVKLFGDSRLVGQLYTCAFGAATVLLGTRLLRLVVGAGWALLGGLVLALLPSQIVFSSVVLREAHVWLCLGIVVAGAALLRSDDLRRVALGAAVAGVGLLGVGFLRQQTLVAAAWALVGAMALVGRHRLLPRLGGALALAVLVPAAAGLGPGGWTLIDRAAPTLARTRTVLSLGADTGYTPTTLAPTTTVPEVPPSGGDGPRPTVGSGGGPRPTVGSGDGPRPTLGSGGGSPATTTPAAAPGALGIAGRDGIPASSGKTYVVDESLDSNLASIPRGLVANILRPFPWEGGTTKSFRLARIENLLWYALYVLALIGAVVGLRRGELREVLLFPAFLTVSVLVIAALTQGNLGTAFRHRQQILLPVLLFAVLGAEWSVARWRARGAAAARAS